MFSGVYALRPRAFSPVDEFGVCANQRCRELRSRFFKEESMSQELCWRWPFAVVVADIYAPSLSSANLSLEPKQFLVFNGRFPADL